ncbi:MAG: 4Fe-4S binding protein [Chloroflexota bacterium]|nr:4Fe-4S binding protein [Chloroflexota bacterium]
MVIESIPKVVGMAYAIVATLVIVLLLRSGRFNKRIGYLFLGVSALLGFLVFAPMLPYQFQSVLLGNTAQLGVPIAAAIAVLALFVVLSFVFGRVFCGYVCPVGAVQELVYHIPVKKMRITSKTVTIVFRLLFLVAFVLLALGFSVGLLGYLGIRDFFYLNFASGFFYVFLTLMIISIVVYRPSCRFFCPYGALLSLATLRGRFKTRRNENCNYCEDCVSACPTNEAGETDLKQECYMCNRCKEACPLDAIEYSTK